VVRRSRGVDLERAALEVPESSVSAFHCRHTGRPFLTLDQCKTCAFVFVPLLVSAGNFLLYDPLRHGGLNLASGRKRNVHAGVASRWTKQRPVAGCVDPERRPVKRVIRQWWPSKRHTKVGPASNALLPAIFLRNGGQFVVGDGPRAKTGLGRV